MRRLVVRASRVGRGGRGEGKMGAEGHEQGGVNSLAALYDVGIAFKDLASQPRT